MCWHEYFKTFWARSQKSLLEELQEFARRCGMNRTNLCRSFEHFRVIPAPVADLPEPHGSPQRQCGGPLPPPTGGVQQEGSRSVAQKSFERFYLIRRVVTKSFSDRKDFAGEVECPVRESRHSIKFNRILMEAFKFVRHVEASIWRFEWPEEFPNSFPFVPFFRN